jgi:hypothetical protein
MLLRFTLHKGRGAQPVLLTQKRPLAGIGPHEPISNESQPVLLPRPIPLGPKFSIRTNPVLPFPVIHS